MEKWIIYFAYLTIFLQFCNCVSVQEITTRETKDIFSAENLPQAAAQYADPCYSRPCQNGGVCSPWGTSFLCHCRLPFYGDRCELSPCSTNPCLNGGICSVTATSFACNCRPGFSGLYCETTGGDCKCKNGNCVVDPYGRYTCQCYDDYGPVSLEKCEACHCGAGASCTFKKGVIFNTKDKCLCPPGQSESNGKCSNCKCKNGNCVPDQYGRYTCQCSDDYGSVSSEECEACHCGKGASCTFKKGILFNTKQKCICPISHSEVDGKCSPWCGTGPCKHGTCVLSLISLPYCLCDKGYKGIYCDEREGMKITTKNVILAVCVVVPLIFVAVALCYRYRTRLRIVRQY